MLRSIIHRWEKFLYAVDYPIHAIPSFESVDDVYTTGSSLVDHIADAIRMDQSVVLEGPRGSGKSWCAGEAINKAVAEGLILEGASLFLQGNKEIPRDYLVEDQIIFQKMEDAKGKPVVIPDRHPAPLFAFAVRNEKGLPKTKADGTIEWRFEDEHPPKKPEGVRAQKLYDTYKDNGIQRFVLFLDEINRFSDGVLDSLLSVLEERKAVVNGRTYKVPVVVIMTMNPPGYDASARRLSPPLAARISRTYKLCSPDLNTLTDQILNRRLKKEREAYAAEKALFAGTDTPSPEFPHICPSLLRRAALVTLCLWGVPEEGSSRVALYCLSPATKTLLANVAKNDHLRKWMKEFEVLCHYGPDGRAVGDWVATAISYAIREQIQNASNSGEGAPKKFELTRKHLLETLIQSIAGKIYDNFSPSSKPQLTQRKHDILREICKIVLDPSQLTDNAVDGLVRKIDQLETLSKLFMPVLDRTHHKDHGQLIGLLREFLIECKLFDSNLDRLCLALDCNKEGQMTESELLRRFVRHGIVEHNIQFNGEQETGGDESVDTSLQNTLGSMNAGVDDHSITRWSWADAAYQKFSERISSPKNQGDDEDDKASPENPQRLFSKQFREVYLSVARSVKGVLEPVEKELARYDIVRLLGHPQRPYKMYEYDRLTPEKFLEFFFGVKKDDEKQFTVHQRTVILFAADLLEELWQNPGFLSLTDDHSMMEKKASEIRDQIIGAIGQPNGKGKGNYKAGFRKSLNELKEWVLYRGGENTAALVNLIEKIAGKLD